MSESITNALDSISFTYLGCKQPTIEIADSILSRLGLDGHGLSSGDFVTAIIGNIPEAVRERLISACREAMATYSTFEPIEGEVVFKLEQVEPDLRPEVLEFMDAVAVAGIIAKAHHMGYCTWGISDAFTVISVLYRFRAYVVSYLSVIKAVIPAAGAESEIGPSSFATPLVAIDPGRENKGDILV